MDLALYCAQQAVVGAAGPVSLLAAKRVDAVDQVCSSCTKMAALTLKHQTLGEQTLFFVRCVTARSQVHI
jgi:hypothetical protein